MRMPNRSKRWLVFIHMVVNIEIPHRNNQYAVPLIKKKSLYKIECKVTPQSIELNKPK